MKLLISWITQCLCLASLLAACSSESPIKTPASALPSLTLHKVAGNLNAPVLLTAPPGDIDRLFVVEQGGTIKIIERTTGADLGTFLTLTGITSGGERGLLGLTFDPQYDSNGRFYVYYTDATGTIIIARFLVSATNPNVADPASQAILVSIPHPNFANHNGGMVTFGPDGCLYAGIGDGGDAGDPSNNAQHPTSRLGKLLRLDPATGTACTSGPLNPFVSGSGHPLVWSYGLRNPWRFSFDGDELYIGDVGQGAREEINVSTGPHAGRGLNYGWRLMEGSACFNPTANCNTGPLTLPIVEYTHDKGACSVIGGYVYRGQAIPAMQGTYFYADFCAGFVHSFRFTNGSATERRDWPLLTTASISSFGQDGLGELYLTSLSGTVFRIVTN
jgi:glucose/arabinose dehydrogenase